VRQAISGAASSAVSMAISGANGCAVGPKAPIKHATDNTEAKPIAPTPTGLMSYKWARRNSMPAGLSPRGLLITKSATTAANQEMAILEYSPSTWPMAWNTSSSINNRAIRILNTIHTTRPGWLWVSREKKFDHASEPA
jgi:hypothetical protein